MDVPDASDATVFDTLNGVTFGAFDAPAIDDASDCPAPDAPDRPSPVSHAAKAFATACLTFLLCDGFVFVCEMVTLTTTEHLEVGHVPVETHDAARVQHNAAQFQQQQLS